MPSPSSANGEETTSHPISLLPFEILGMVFLCARSMFVDSTPRDRDEAILCLSSVCSFWRTICLDTPKLWNLISWEFIELRLEEGIDSDWYTDHLVSSSSLKRFQLFLERSKCTQIDVVFRIHLRPNSVHFNPQVHSHAWDLLKPNAHRCRTLLLHTWVLPETIEFPIPLFGGFSHLESLDFEASLLRIDRPLFLPEFTSPLAKLHVRRVPDVANTFLLNNAPADQLNTVTIVINAIVMPSVLAFLGRCPQLQYLHISWAGRMPSAELGHQQKVTLPALTELHATGIAPYLLQSIINTPRLLRLILVGGGQWANTETWRTEGVKALTQWPVLEEVEFHARRDMPSPTRETILQLVRDNPSIRRLRLKDCDDGSLLLYPLLRNARRDVGYTSGSTQVEAPLHLELLEFINCPTLAAAIDPGLYAIDKPAIREVLALYPMLQIVLRGTSHLMLGEGDLTEDWRVPEDLKHLDGRLLIVPEVDKHEVRVFPVSSGFDIDPTEIAKMHLDLHYPVIQLDRRFGMDRAFEA